MTVSFSISNYTFYVNVGEVSKIAYNGEWDRKQVTRYSVVWSGFTWEILNSEDILFWTKWFSGQGPFVFHEWENRNSLFNYFFFFSSVKKISFCSYKLLVSGFCMIYSNVIMLGDVWKVRSCFIYWYNCPWWNIIWLRLMVRDSSR